MKITLNQDTPAGAYDVASIDGSITLTLDIPAPTSMPAPAPAQTVTVTGTLADGTAVSVQLQPGQRKPLVPGKIVGSAIYHADGLSVCIENGYMGTTGPLSGTFTVSAGTTQLFSGALTIGAYKRTRPFWLSRPQPKAAPDWSAWPTFAVGAGSKAGMYAQYSTADNSPMGRGLAYPQFEATGERPDLGGPLWDVAYITNPNADNAAVVRGMSDAASVWAVHVIDPATNDMVDMSGNPYITTQSVMLGKNNNPIVAWIDDGSGLSLSQAQAHATNFSLVAAELYGTDYDREEVGFWCNYYQSLWQNPAYRQANGCVTFAHCQVRGKGRGLDYLLMACKYAPAKWQPMFQGWVESLAADGASRWPKQSGIQIDQLTAQADPTLYSVWDQQVLTGALGRAIDHGYTAFQPLLDYFAKPVFDAVLGDGAVPAVCHEMASGYKYNWVDASGSVVADWRAVCNATATKNTPFSSALSLPEDSLARINALESNASGYQAGDFSGYPWSPTGFSAFLRLALVALANHATDQTSAQAAWTKFMKYYRADHSTDPKYDVVPKAA